MDRYTIFQLQAESGLTMLQLRHRIRTLSIKARGRKYYFESDLQLIMSCNIIRGNNYYHVYESSLNLIEHETDCAIRYICP